MPKKRPRPLRSLGLASLYTHVAAPGSINCKRITVKPARGGFVSMCARTEPVRTGIGAVCVECSRPKWPMTMLNQTRVQKNVCFLHFWHPMFVRPAMKRLFIPKGKNRPRSLRSLGLAIFRIFPDIVLFDGFI